MKYALPYVALTGLLAAGLLCLGMTDAHAAATMGNKKVVRSHNGEIVRAQLTGTCVRTDWVAGQDPCAPTPPAPKVAAYIPPPMPAPAPVIVEQRREVLNSDEKNIYFNFNSTTLTPGAKAKLDVVASKLSSASSVRGAEIVGYADRIGAQSYNTALSQKRAKAVQDYLTQRGYLNIQIARVRGLGESNPITNCSKGQPRAAQIECLGADRRVDLEVQYTKTEVQNVVVPQTSAAPAAQNAHPIAYAVPVTEPAYEGKLLYRSVAPATYQ
ncbi:MAG: hypothetical protein EB059_03830 [Alphaproteobacteria bacterium]|nr:hypothetical protein [Alphaproteobacteria bacterium]